MTRTEKYKYLHLYLSEENRAFEQRKKEGKMSLNDLFVETLTVDAKHAKSRVGEW